jgi:uncharacterized protein (DUF305 family)
VARDGTDDLPSRTDDLETTLMKRKRMLASTAAGVALALSLAACGAGSSPVDEATDATMHDDADTQFAQMMVIHHEGAVEMGRLAADSGGSAEVRELGERIAAAQSPEIELMSSWLESWGEDEPDDAEMGSMDHGGMDMEGMDQDEVMGELSGLTGEAFDRRFLELMTDHHRGAIEMAEEHMADGSNAEAKELSAAIVSAQTAEIDEMTQMLDDLE